MTKKTARVCVGVRRVYIYLYPLEGINDPTTGVYCIFLKEQSVTLKDVKLFIVNRQNVSEIFVNIHNVNLFNVKPKELSKAGLYVCKGTKQ